LPTYQYRCITCGHKLEAVQSFSDAPLTECPDCGSVLRKQYGSVGVVFKGSGFYRNDSRPGNGEKRDKADADRKPDKADGEKTPAKTDGDRKPDKKPDTTTSPTTTKPDKKSDAAATTRTEGRPAARTAASARDSGSAA